MDKAGEHGVIEKGKGSNTSRRPPFLMSTLPFFLWCHKGLTTLRLSCRQGVDH